MKQISSAQHKMSCAWHNIWRVLDIIYMACARHKMLCARHKMLCALHKMSCTRHNISLYAITCWNCIVIFKQLYDVFAVVGMLLFRSSITLCCLWFFCRFQRFFCHHDCGCLLHWDRMVLSSDVLPTLMHRTADTRHEYTTQSHYTDTWPTSPGFILLMLSV